MVRRVLAVAFCCLAAPVAAQAPAEPQGPPIRRWLDVQNIHFSSRFRWVKSNDGRITSSTFQWQPNVRGRVLIDREARYSVGFNANSGGHFVSGWNNTGAGLGGFGGDFHLKQLFVSAEPVGGVEFEAGGLHLLRGENTEITAYDNDAYIVGERFSVRRSDGVFAQFAVTVGHIGDYRTPNVFKRLDSITDVNYGQLFLGGRAGRRIMASADYTYEDGRDLLRAGLAVRMPSSVAPVAAVRFEAYQRLSDATGAGFNVSTDLRVTPALTVTGGVAHVDRQYLIPGYISPNGDRYERGTRFYSQGTYRVSREWSIGWFHAEAFKVDYAIPNERRWEAIVTFNPTAALKASRVF